MFVRITYSNGYCGCDETEVLEVEDMKEVETYAAENINQYAENYEFAATGWDEDFESEDDKYDYYDNCTYDIKEITEEEYKEEIFFFS